MDERTRRTILSSFPENIYGVDWSRCRHINLFSGQQCLQPIFGNQTMPACQRHINDFIIFERTNRNEQIVPDPQMIVNYFTPVDPIPPFPKYSEIATLIETSDECAVCSENEKLLSLPCRHVCCYTCVKSLRNNQCPVCRMDISIHLIRKI